MKPTDDRPDLFSFAVRSGWKIAPEAAGRIRADSSDGMARIGRIELPVAFELLADERDRTTGVVTRNAVLLFAVDEGEIQATGVYSDTHDIDQALAWLLSLSSLSGWKRAAITCLAMRETEKSGILDLDRADEVAVAKLNSDIKEAATAANNAPVTRRRNRITDGHLREVAQVYRTATESGEPPTMAVAGHFTVSHSTAARWVGLARRRALMGPSDGSRGGERSDGFATNEEGTL